MRAERGTCGGLDTCGGLSLAQTVYPTESGVLLDERDPSQTALLAPLVRRDGDLALA
jgi:hypothetical protein